MRKHISQIFICNHVCVDGNFALQLQSGSRPESINVTVTAPVGFPENSLVAYLITVMQSFIPAEQINDYSYRMAGFLN